MTTLSAIRSFKCLQPGVHWMGLVRLVRSYIHCIVVRVSSCLQTVNRWIASFTIETGGQTDHVISHAACWLYWSNQQAAWWCNALQLKRCYGIHLYGSLNVHVCDAVCSQWCPCGVLVIHSTTAVFIEPSSMGGWVVAFPLRCFLAFERWNVTCHH